MNIYLCDHDYVEGEGWSGALSDVFASPLWKMAVQWNEPEDVHPGYTDANAVIFVHSEMESAWIRKINAGGIVCHFVFVRSGGNQRAFESCPGNVHVCYWSPQHFREANRPTRLTRLIEQLKKDDPAGVDWSLLQHDAVEPILTARLLIEAKKHEGKTLHGFEIGRIPEALVVNAMGVLKADSTNTRVLESCINELASSLERCRLEKR